MAPVQGKDFRLKVENAVPAFVLVGYMNNYSRDTDKPVDTFPVFGLDTPPAIAGSRGQTYSVSGLFDPTDAGQVILRTADIDSEVASIQVLFDGTNGFTQDVEVNSMSHSATPDGFQETGFEFTADADAVIVGTGPVM
jgi:hypothetical protein